MWKVYKLPTSNFLYYRHILPKDSCNFNKQEPKIVNHVLFHCNFARPMWFGYALSIRTNHTTPRNLKSWLLSCFNIGCNNLNFHLQLTCHIAITTYAIWFSQNQKAFHNLAPNPINYLKNIKRWRKDI